MSDHLTLSVTASGVPRGSGDQTETVFVAQSMTASFAWGSAPGTATIVYVGNGAPIQTGAMIELRLGAHYFCGICKSDVGNTGSSEGMTRTLQFADLREFLSWDYVFCAFNKPWVVLVNGLRQKRYRHVYPANFDTLTWTITNAPLNATEILEALFEAPTVGTRWAWDLTDRNLFPGGLMNYPIYDFDCLGGKRLDAALNEICERAGCVFGLISTPLIPYNLVFTRKGYGTMADFPANSDNRRTGVALSGHPTNARVLGDRNFYQVMDVGMEPDWAPAWEAFIVFELFTEDIYQRLYAATPGDPEGYVGRQLANARALSITVAEYVALAGAQFADGRKYAGRWRMDMPCALYISQLLMRAFRPAAGFVFTNAEQSEEGAFSANAVIPLTSLDIADRLLCKVYQSDPTDGTMQFDLNTPADGNGYAIVQGYQVGADLFKTIGSAQFNLDFFKNVTGVWSHTSFQIDDSGEGVRFIIFDEPVIVSDDLVVGVDGHAVINADFTLRVPVVKAALVFEAERFSYWQGTWPNVGRDVVENVGGLNAELVVADGEYQEVLYANGVGSQAKAREIATWTLLRQYYYAEGGFKLIWVPATPVASFGMGLTSLVDRVTITMSPREGTVEVVDLTNERQRDFFEPEREFDRRTMGTSLFPGQAELRIQAEYSRKLAAAFKQLPGVGARLSDLLNGALGNDEPLLDAWFVGAAALAMPAGTVIRKAPTTIGAPNTNTVATPTEDLTEADSVFVGVTVRDNEATTKPFKVQRSGVALARVRGPVKANDAVGLSADTAYLVAGGTPSVGLVRQEILDDSVKLIEVDLGSGGGGGASGPYRVKDVEDDYLVCRTWDGTSEGTDDVYIAKEYKHRNTLRAETLLGEDHTYTYEADTEEADPDQVNVTRHDSVPSATEGDPPAVTDERLVPPWVIDEEIMAVAGKTGVVTLDYGGSAGAQDVTLLITGRSCQWAEKS